MREDFFRMLMCAFETNACIYRFSTSKSILLKLSWYCWRGGETRIFFFFKQIGQTEECKRSAIISVESLPIVLYALSFSPPFVTQCHISQM